VTLSTAPHLRTRHPDHLDDKSAVSVTDGRRDAGASRRRQRFDLSRRRLKKERSILTWVVELSYEQIADYHPRLQVADSQQVAFAAKLFDNSEVQLPPQPALLAMPVSATLVRLSAGQAVPVPVPIRRRW
jgi:hypothetical protein